MLKLLVLALVATAAVAEKKSYAGYKAYKTASLTPDQARALQILQATTSLDFWKDPVPGRPAEVMASPDDASKVTGALDANGISYHVSVEDVQKGLDAVSGLKGQKVKRDGPAPRYNLDWDDFYGHDSINEFIDELGASQSYTNSRSVATTEEGRDIRALEITKAGAGAPNIFIEAGIHAREWIANTVATYTAHKLLEDADGQYYIDNYNWYIVPMANPDGYEFSYTDDRMWRKNRQDNGCGDGNIGTDLNRNFEYHWGESGVDFDPCSNVFPGDGPLSDRESIGLANYFHDVVGGSPSITICFHSAAELWLYPYGYALNKYPDNVADIIAMGNKAVNALNAVNDEQFVLQNSADLYPAAGASDDYYQSEGSEYTYTPELRVGDENSGFGINPEEIIPSGEEIWAAWKAMIAHLEEKKR